MMEAFLAVREKHTSVILFRLDDSLLGLKLKK